MNPARLLILVAATAMALALSTGVAAAAFSVTPTRTIPIGSFGGFGGYAPGFDGSFWTIFGGSSGATVGHVDDEGNNLGDGFNVTTAYPLGIAYYGGRVYIPNSSGGSRITSFRTSDGGDQLSNDTATNERIGSNQAILRAYSDGSSTLAMGQNAKVARLTLSKNIVAHPWYPQAFYGNGINKSYDPVFNSFETCSLNDEGLPVAGEPQPTCGKNGYFDNGDGTHPGFGYARDAAFGAGGIYVADTSRERIIHVDTVTNPGGTLDFSFGIGPGSGNGQLTDPQSVVVQPGTGRVFVSDEGNRRISVYTSGGGFIASFGYGVLNGKDEIQACGQEIGNCQAGTPYQSNSRSYFSRLDFGPEGELLAHMPLVGQIQVFSLGDVAGPPSGAPGPPAPGAPNNSAEGKEVIRLSAKPTKVEKNSKTKLTAIVNRGKDCANRKVLFQLSVPRSWDNLGSAVKVGKGCKVSKRYKVGAKSVFKAVLIDPRNQATLATSPKVTVKLK